MKEVKEETITFSKIISLTCDKCKKVIPKDDIIEWQEAYTIEFRGGFGSVFGDGNEVECDLCQSCLKELIGPYAKVSDEWINHL